MEFTSTTFWIVLGLVLGGSELLVGTFFLLVLSISSFFAAAASYYGGSIDCQCMVFSLAMVAGGYTLSQLKKRCRMFQPKSSDYDIGQVVSVEAWNEDRTAKVNYRGSTWVAQAEEGATLASGPFKITAISGSRLIVTNIH